MAGAPEHQADRYAKADAEGKVVEGDAKRRANGKAQTEAEGLPRMIAADLAHGTLR